MDDDEDVTACQIEGCTEPGRVYYRYGRTVSNMPFTYSGIAQTLPESPRNLCPEHALKEQGVAWTRLPGDPS